MTSWTAGPEKPSTVFCWRCSKRFHGRVFMRVRDGAGYEHDIHKACADPGDIVTLRSGTATLVTKVLRALPGKINLDRIHGRKA